MTFYQKVYISGRKDMIVQEWDTGLTVRLVISETGPFSVPVYGRFTPYEAWNCSLVPTDGGYLVTGIAPGVPYEVGFNARKIIIEPLVGLEPAPPICPQGSEYVPDSEPVPGVGQPRGDGLIDVWLSQVKLGKPVNQRLANRLCVHGWAEWISPSSIRLKRYPRELR